MTPSRVEPKKRLQELEVVFSALAHPARRQILLTVHFWGGTMRAGDVAKRFGHSWPTTTRHLNVLVEAGLLSNERVGRTNLYRLQREGLRVVEEWFGWFDKVPAVGAARERALRVVGA